MTDAACWPEPFICEDCCKDLLGDGDTAGSLDPAVVQVLKDTANRILWAATGKRFGLCETTLRPCRRECGSFWGGLPFPTRIAGEWVNIGCGSCAGRCGCSVLSEFIADDVDSVVSVFVDGEELNPEQSVLVYDRRRVVRLDGTWPTCQNLAEPPDVPGTWAVTVMQGTPVPDGAEVMAGLLVCELAKACVDDDSCRLPRRIQTAARQGLTFNFTDVFASVGDMRTGLFEVDLWIEAATTTKGAYATISSPDLPRPAVQTWPNPGSGSL